MSAPRNIDDLIKWANLTDQHERAIRFVDSIHMDGGNTDLLLAHLAVSNPAAVLKSATATGLIEEQRPADDDTYWDDTESDDPPKWTDS